MRTYARFLVALECDCIDDDSPKPLGICGLARAQALYSHILLVQILYHERVGYLIRTHARFLVGLECGRIDSPTPLRIRGTAEYQALYSHDQLVQELYCER